MKKYVVGNWKMNLTRTDARELVSALHANGAHSTEQVSVVICPPFTVLSALQEPTGHSIALGAQNCHTAEKGAYTGEISAQMLTDVGCAYVIVGHSERRRDQQESDDQIGRKAHRALASDLRPIICVGESLEQRQQGITHSVITAQLNGIIDAASEEVVASSIIAYEPVWAIGTGLAATSEQAQEVHRDIRQHLQSRGISNTVPILYGGSVTSANASSLFDCPDIDGALVGGASLNAADFAAIVATAQKAWS
jgi:triosephosphate isomerase